MHGLTPLMQPRSNIWTSITAQGGRKYHWTKIGHTDFYFPSWCPLMDHQSPTMNVTKTPINPPSQPNINRKWFEAGQLWQHDVIQGEKRNNTGRRETDKQRRCRVFWFLLSISHIGLWAEREIDASLKRHWHQSWGADAQPAPPVRDDVGWNSMAHQELVVGQDSAEINVRIWTMWYQSHPDP